MFTSEIYLTAIRQNDVPKNNSISFGINFDENSIYVGYLAFSVDITEFKATDKTPKGLFYNQSLQIQAGKMTPINFFVKTKQDSIFTYDILASKFFINSR